MTLGSAPFARADIITCIDIDSESGAVAILAGNHGNASLWSYPDGLLLCELATPAFDTTFVKFLAGGRVATGHKDGSLRLWRSGTGRLEVLLTGHKAAISHLAADVNGRHAMSIDSAGHCVEWDMKTGAPTCSHEIGCVVQPPYSISADLKTVAGVSANGLGIVVWHVAKQKVSIMEDSFNELVMGVAIDAGGGRVAAGDKNGIVRIWDVPSGRVEYSPGRLVSGLLYSITFAPQGESIAVGGYPNSAIYKLATKRLVSIKGPPKVSVSAVAFAEAGKCLIAGGSDGLVRFYDGDSGARKHSGIGHESAVTAIADGPSSPDLFSAGTYEGSICQWDVERGVLKNLSQVPGSTSAIALLPKDNLVALGYDDGKLRLAPLDSRSVLREYSLIGSPVITISLSSRGVSVLSGHIDGSIAFIHGADYILVPSERSKYSTVKCSDMSPSGDLAVTGHGDGMMRFWRLPSGALAAEARASSESINAVRLARAGRICLVGDHKGRISAWNILLATRILDLGGHDSPVTSLDISPVGNIAASADKSGSVTLWEMASGGILTQKSLGKGEITTVKIVNKGRAVACGMATGCIELESVGVLSRRDHATSNKAVTQDELANMWSKLGSESPNVSSEAAAWWAEGASDGRISYLASRVQSYKPSHDISSVIQALESDSVEAREKAAKILINLDIEAESSLKQVAMEGKSIESQERARYILGQSSYPIMRTAEARQISRAIAIITEVEVRGSDWENALNSLKMKAQSVLARRIVDDIISALK